jgi:hypothetical protein
VSAGGSGDDAWYVFEPARPRPRRAPLAIVMHGYYEFAGYDQMYAFIRHTVRRGSIVIYPRWQTAIATPCPGPFDVEPCLTSAANGIRGALSYLRARPRRVQPQLARTSYFGFSFGGIVTTNLANRYRSLHLPKPRAIFLDDPHDGGLNGFDEPAVDDDLSGIPPTVRLQCHSGAEGVISGPATPDASCNAIFPRLGHIPARNKDLVMTHPDAHGVPRLSSAHGVCAGAKGAADAYDWNFCWKVWDGLRACAYSGRWCGYALGDTRRHRSNGRWSDGVPVAPLTVQDAAPIRPAVTREQAEALGREAYRYGLPLLEFLRVRRENTSVKAPDGHGNAPLNRFSNARRFAGPENRTVVAPNVDTLYSIAQLDLGKGPIVLSHPNVGGRYFVFQLLDPYTNTIAYVGSRRTGAKAGRFAITWTKRPGRRVRGVRVVRSRYRRLWVIGRTLAGGTADQRRAYRLMRRYRLTPLRLLGRKVRHPRRRPGEPATATTPRGLAFLDALGAAMKANPPPARDRPLLRRLATVGIAPGRRPSTAGLPAVVLDGLRAGAEAEAAALADTRSEILTQAIANGGWYVPPPRIGDYGTDYLLRARIAVAGLGANTRIEAVYPTALADSQGRLLSGANRYRIAFAPGQAPPARAFWSLTMYDLAGYLVANPANRYAVGDSHPPLVKRPDGSIVVAIQRDRPADATVNWLPAPAGAFRLSLRIYLPERRVLSGAWKPPPVELVP